MRTLKNFLIGLGFLVAFVVASNLGSWNYSQGFWSGSQGEPMRYDEYLRIPEEAQFADRCPPYCDGKCIHGDRYRVTISRKAGGRISFDFWNSHNDMCNGNEPTAYDVLACMSADVNCPESLDEFCGEYGYDIDSRKAEATFRRCNAFGRKLRAFFSATEQEALQEIL